MAWRFPQEYVRDGDVIEPSDWRSNLNEVLSEINGYLDRDNIQQKLLQPRSFERETFTAVRSNIPSSMSSYVFNMNKDGWIKKSTKITDTQSLFEFVADIEEHPYYKNPDVKPPSDYGEGFLPQVILNPDSSGLLIAEFSGTVNWPSRSSHPDQMYATGKGFDRAAFVEDYAYYAPQDKKYKSLSAFIQCSMWRLTVDGQTIAETGPIGNEYSSHPIYLCGATPVTNRDEIKVQLECRFVWYSPGTNSFKSASGYQPIAKDVDAGGGSSESAGIRTDCVLSCPNLIVTFRKR